jgi:hypothetical protein
MQPVRPPPQAARGDLCAALWLVPGAAGDLYEHMSDSVSTQMVANAHEFCGRSRVSVTCRNGLMAMVMVSVCRVLPMGRAYGLGAFRRVRRGNGLGMICRGVVVRLRVVICEFSRQIPMCWSTFGLPSLHRDAAAHALDQVRFAIVGLPNKPFHPQERLRARRPR